MTEIPKTDFQALVFLMAILMLSFFIYKQNFNSSFVWDDVSYVQNNEMVQQPLSKSIPHFFGLHYYQGNYHPLTMSLYSMIFQKAGLNTSLYHIVQLVFHLLNIILVFLFCQGLLNSNSRVSLLVAGLFALHPMHVESVAWISSMKDVLFCFFFLLSLICYQKYLSRNSKTLYYFLTFTSFLLSALSKPTALCLPFILWCLDYWHYQKLEFKNLLNKIPFIVISLVFGIITLKAQVDSINAVAHYNWIEKIQISSTALYQYLIKLFYPFHLSALYPLPKNEEINSVFFIALLLCILIAIIFFKKWKNERILIFGISFFVLTIALMLQFVTVGMAIIADRYTYLSYLGPFIIIAWYYDKLCNANQKIANSRILQYLIIAVPIILSAGLSKDRIKVWANNKNLWSDVIHQFPQSSVAHYNLGSYYFLEEKDDVKAASYFTRSLDLDPKRVTALINMGVITGKQKNFELALIYFDRAIKVDPNYPDIYKNRGYVYGLKQDIEPAIQDFTRYLSMQKKDAMIYYYRGMLYQMKNSMTEALADLNNAISLNPRIADFYIQRAKLYKSTNRMDESKTDLLKAQSLDSSKRTMQFEQL